MFEHTYASDMIEYLFTTQEQYPPLSQMTFQMSEGTEAIVYDHYEASRYN